MLYMLFLVIAILYNLNKFSKERAIIINSLVNATAEQHRNMILSHHFHIFIFEAFLGFIVSHLISEGAFVIGLLGFGGVYVLLVGFGLYLYQYFLKYIEKTTSLDLRHSFNQHVIKEFRVSFGLIILPILVYSLLSWTFQIGEVGESGSFWIVEFLTNFIFVSVLTVSCTVVIMLRLLPNREITEPEYLEIINKRLEQINIPNMRIKWIETDIKNAFVVGLKLLKFSNQTMFIGRNLRTMLTIEEFDAVIAHELSHVANRHVQKRMIELLKNFVSAIIGFLTLMLVTLSFFHLTLGEDLGLYDKWVTVISGAACIGWLFFNYSLFFDTIRSHEYEADAYAVMELGVDFEAFKSALTKLTVPDDIPEYLKAKQPKPRKKNAFWRLFSTHPELEERIFSLEYKMANGLPFNFYVSTPQKLRKKLGFFLQWKISAPVMTGLMIFAIWSGINFKEGARLVSFIKGQDPQSIINNELISREINKKPFLIGKSLMFYIVQKQDPKLIDYYLSQGADPGRTLIYLSETKNFDLFNGYYPKLSQKISQDEFFLVLLKSAEVNFTDGYRYLVNSSRFESLESGYKQDLARSFHPKNKQRSPASVEK